MYRHYISNIENRPHQPSALTQKDKIALYKEEQARGERLTQLREALSQLIDTYDQEELSGVHVFDNGLLFISYLLR